MKRPAPAVTALALGAMAAASLIAAGAGALAAVHATHGNYRGPARAAHVVTVPHHSNYRGSARPSGTTPAVRGSNVPAAVAAQRQAQKGSSPR